MRRLLPLVLAACSPDLAPEAQPLPEELAPAPGVPVLTAPPYVFRGESLAVRITQGPRTRLMGIVSSSSLSGDFCPDELGGTCMDLGEPASLIGTVTTNGNGAADYSLVVSPRGGTLTLQLQAASYVRGVAWISNVDPVVILKRTDDTDGDGVINITERTLGLDPLNPDTDGGGQSDGDEVNAGLDPRDASDDNVPS